MNTFFHHIPFGRLIDYVDGNIPLIQRVDLEAHFTTCSRCAGKLARVEHLIGLMRTDTAEDAPPHVFQHAIDLFRLRTIARPSTSDLRRRILASLQFNSRVSAPAFGVRSGKPGAQQLLFHAEKYQIDLRIAPAGGAWLVSGQVLGGDTANWTAVLQDTTGIRQTDFNALSEFMLEPVKEGTYKLILNLTNLDLEIEEIRIGS